MERHEAALQGEIPGGFRTNDSRNPREGFTSEILTQLRVEGGADCAAAIFAYANAGYSWQLFAILLLAPDLSFIGYLAGPRIGAAIYNFAHNYAGALALWVAGGVIQAPLLSILALIWIAHIGLDRALCYGLKLSTSFSDTHLGPIGRSRHGPKQSDEAHRSR